jgi:FAD-dependent urate hydroxylase
MKRSIFFLLFLTVRLYSLVLEQEVMSDLESIGIHRPTSFQEVEILDVAIIGGGQAGMSVCLGLWKKHIFNVVLFDCAEEGFEGPWLNTARMKCLRSNKEGLIGPSLGLPHLSFPVWFEATYGNWTALERVPTSLWAEYLHWFQRVLTLPVKHGWRLLSILPDQGKLKLRFNDQREIYVHKVVLATGRTGCGGFALPTFLHNMPKSFWFHTGEVIPINSFRGKRILIVGAGASAFDAAATALEQDAQHVTMIMRREHLPTVNLFDVYPCWPIFFSLSDEERLHFFQTAIEAGAPPPSESIARLSHWSNFQFIADCCIESISHSEHVVLSTNQGILETDLMIFATGYAVDLQSVPELNLLCDEIQLWEDRLECPSSKLARFPYLGKNFEFLEKIPGSAPYLKDIHCFNYGAYLSHGRISGDIDQIAIGVERLTEGIAADLDSK